jgi:hypothetical protein
MKKFEYSTLIFDSAKFFTGAKLDHETFHQRLNAYGADGWELVNVFTLSRVEGVVFKRPTSP